MTHLSGARMWAPCASCAAERPSTAYSASRRVGARVFLVVQFGQAKLGFGVGVSGQFFFAGFDGGWQGLRHGVGLLVVSTLDAKGRPALPS